MVTWLSYSKAKILQIISGDPDAFRLSTMHISQPASKEFEEPNYLKEVRAEEDIEEHY